MKKQHRSTLLLVVALLGVVGIFLPAAAAADTVTTIDPRAEGLSSPEKVEVLLNRVKSEQEKIETLAAKFVQVQESEFLVEPEESRGRFYYAAPSDVRWEYQSPDPITVLINEGTMTSWYRDLGRADKLQVGEKSARVLKYMGAGGNMAALEEYFDIAAAFPDDASLPYRLELTPRYERIAKRLRSITIWIDPERFLPQRLLYEDGDGDVTDLRFDELVVNAEISADRFRLDLPADVEVKVVDLESSK